MPCIGFGSVTGGFLTVAGSAMSIIPMGIAMPIVAHFAAVFTRNQSPLTGFIDVVRNSVIGRATLATEHQREKRLVRFARLSALFDQREIAA